MTSPEDVFVKNPVSSKDWVLFCMIAVLKGEGVRSKQLQRAAMYVEKLYHKGIIP